MGGGLMQLVAYGAQDIYLTGNPQITFFKVVYRRHTNFAMEAIQQSFNGSVGEGNRVSCVVSRNGDLVHRMYLEMNVTGTSLNTSITGTAVTEVGNALVKSAEVEIGGQRVDKQYGTWMTMWSELSLPAGQSKGYQRLVQRVGADGSFTLTATGVNQSKTVRVPLQFWFCRNPGCALPLIALQYHEVRVNIEFCNKLDICADNAGATLLSDLTNVGLWVDYVYLDTDERRRFAQVSHEYLIEQVQHTGVESCTGSAQKVRLNFNHPVKELVWGVQASGSGKSTLLGGSTDNIKLQLNGHDRFSERKGDYFQLVQPYQHHTNIPTATSKKVYAYSFALRPEEHQPSGTCNFSRIDNATLNLTAGSSGDSLWIFAHSYNVLRVMSGMGGLAYSN